MICPEYPMSSLSPMPFRLVKEHDSVFLRFDGDGERTRVKILLARPLTARGGEIAFLDEKKKEIAMVESLDALDADSRKIAMEELEKRYLSARVTRVLRAWNQLGARYFEVETDRGPRTFVIQSVNRHIAWGTEDRLLFRDTLGNRYEVPSLRKLDARSLAELDNVI